MRLTDNWRGNPGVKITERSNYNALTRELDSYSVSRNLFLTETRNFLSLTIFTACITASRVS
jgi:hypothetical protein